MNFCFNGYINKKFLLNCLATYFIYDSFYNFISWAWCTNPHSC